MKKPYFPVYTRVGPNPVAVCEKLPVQVFEYPFFNDGAAMQPRSNPKRKELRLQADPIFPNQEFLKLKGFIFHTSHCGSTLLSNMLKSSKQTRIVAETEAINGLLLSAIFYKLDKEEVLRGLTTIVSAYLQPLGNAKNVIFKLTSWNIFFIELFQKAYPNVPWIFIERNSADVVKSLLKNGRGFVEWWYHPTDLLQKYFLGKNPQPETFDAYLFEMVEAHKAAAQKGNSSNKLALEYPDFINEFESRVLLHFNLNFTNTELEVALEKTKFDAKSIEKSEFLKDEETV
ncbi:hypothetical protein QRD02_07615 [Aequorivita sp. SDUM287046]|uniref:Sulfotransferase family protein n=1 Tax=Aequorivita aurantiaca TaxID=3053356 RepID=A0ABT8DFV9_9FLAO|nr:hypothetical protein [Aequorivita aurantiaca]MDN3724246.1 hypothetical protein [Aequorivita aurantiaca]